MAKTYTLAEAAAEIARMVKEKDDTRSAEANSVITQVESAFTARHEWKGQPAPEKVADPQTATVRDGDNPVRGGKPPGAL